MEELAVLSGRSIASVSSLAAVSEYGVIPLPGELVLETDVGYVLMSYVQTGLTITAPVPRQALRWPTEPDLAMTRDGAEEWLDLADIGGDDDHTVLPPLPLTVRAVDVWTVRGSYLAGASVALSDGATELVIRTTADFDLVCVTRGAGLEYLDILVRNLSMPLHHTSVVPS